MAFGHPVREAKFAVPTFQSLFSRVGADAGKAEGRPRRGELKFL